MKHLYKLTFFALLISLSSVLFAQQSTFNFMRLSGEGVTLRHGSYDNPRAMVGQSAHELLTRSALTSLTDERTGDLLNILPDAETDTVFQLGDTLVSGYSYGLPNTATGIYPSNVIDYVFDVDETNSLLLLNFAVVFEDPGGHTTNHKPLFGVKISDINDNTLDPCTEYEVYALEGNAGFETYQYYRMDYVNNEWQNVLHTVRWRDWTAIGLDLSPYIGGAVKVSFTTKDCYDGSHYAYTYFTAKCVNNSLAAQCIDDDHVTLAAPLGFETYTWSGAGGNASTATYDIPDNGLRVTCHLESFTGCECDLMAYIVRYNVTPGTHILYDTTCISQPYTYSHYDIPTSDLMLGDNVFVNTIVEAGDCNNVATSILQLYVVDALEKHVYADVCEVDGYRDDSITIRDGIILGNHTYTFNLHSGLGCDSTVYVHLNTTANPKRFEYFTKCQGDVFDVHYGYSSSKTYHVGADAFVDTIRFDAPSGCDSLVIVSVDVNPAWTLDNVNDISSLLYTELGITALCVNDVIDDFHGFHIVPDEENPNEIYDTLWLHTSNGCDSIVVINLGVLPYNNETQYFSSCFGDPTNNNIYYAMYGGNVMFPERLDVGHYVDTIHYPHMFSNCDSWAIRVLDVWPVEDTIVRDTICSNQTYDRNGFTYTPNPPYYPYGIYGINDFSFIHRDTLNIYTQHGCDSTVYLELVVKKAFSIPVYAEICEGESYINDTLPFMNQTTPSVGIMQYLYPYTSSINGCDSIYELTLNVKEVFEQTREADICLGEVYHDDDFDTIPATVGLVEMTATYTSIFACDSIIYLSLNVHPVYDSTFTQEICYGESYTNYGFDIQTPDVGWHIDEYVINPKTKNYGCDSIVRLNLLVNPIYNFTLTDEICYGESYVNDSGNYNIVVPDVGVYNNLIHAYTTDKGCDSIFDLSLTVKEVYHTNIYADLCLGERYNENGFDTIPTAVGIVRDTLFLTSILYCDSIVALELNVRPVYDYTIVDSICYGENYAINGFNILTPAVGMHVDEYMINPHTNIYGCDSIVRLTLKVNEAPYTVFRDTVCEGSSYNNHNFVIASVLAGEHSYEATYSSIYACDSLVRLYLYGNPLLYNTINDVACVGEAYTQYGFNETPDAIGPHNYQMVVPSAVTGCDSTVYLNLDVYDGFVTNILDSICLGDTYYDNGFNLTPMYPTTLYQSFTTQSQYGCDSVVNLTLKVYSGDYLSFKDTVCWNDTYTLHGFNINVAERFPNVPNQASYNIYNDTSAYNIHGCLDNVNVYLTVNPVDVVDVYGEICEGEDYDGYNFHITNTVAGNYVYDNVMPSERYGCDSTTYLHLTVHPVFLTVFEEYIGLNQDYHGHGFDIIQPAEGLLDTVNHLYSIHGCDSLVNLKLNVFPTVYTWIEDSICFGEDYTDYGFNYINPAVGNYLDTVINYDSNNVPIAVFYLDLDVNDVYDYTITEEICYGADYTENNFNYILPDAGHYDEVKNLTTIHGCDSIVRLSLDVYPTFYTHATDSVCKGDVYVGPGFMIFTDTLSVGRHQDTTTLQTIHMCDSIIYLDLTVLPLYDTVILDTICYKNDYTLNGFDIIYPNIGDTFDTLFLTTINGCDSTVYLELHVKPSQDTIIDASICHGEDYIGNGFEYIQPEVGTIHDTLWFTNIYGCDSAVMLELKVNPTYDKVVVASICEGEDYNENGFHIVAPSLGLHLDTITFSSTHGCDSVVSLNLMVYPKFETVLDVEIASGDDYIENGFVYIEPRVGIYHDSLLYNSVHGCDSMVKLNLTVMPDPEVFIEDTVCQGVDYLLEGFVVLHGQTSGLVHDTLFLTNMFGGDSTVYLTLTVLPEYDTVFTEYICYGESYTEHGFNYINPAVGTYIDTMRYETVMGCDSTMYLNLTVYPLMDSLVVAEICEGENYVDNEFIVIQPPVGLYRDTVLVGDEYGCTMYYLELTVNPKNYTFLMPQICEGSDYVSNGFNIIQPAAGMVYDTLFLSNDYGCDSTVYLALTVNPAYNTYFTDSICYGEDYINHGFTILHPEVGVIEESYVLPTIDGCDSTIFLTLTVNPVYDTLINAQICHGESYEENGFSFIDPEVGVYFDTLFLNSIYGCDSVVSLQLAVNPVYDTLFVDEICHGEDYTLHGFNVIQPAIGTYNETLYLTTVNGCDSLVYLDLTINPDYKLYFEGELCYGENYVENGFNIIKPAVGVHNDSIILSTVHGCDSIMYLTLTVHPVYETWYEAEICSGEDYVGHGFEFIHPTVGLHRDTLFYETVHGCDSLICMKLRVWPLFNIQINETICHGESYNENGFNIINPPVGVTRDTLFLSSIHGCDSIVRLALNVLPIFDFGDSKIVGQHNAYVSTNLQTGRYKYVIDPIQYCNEYHWELTGADDWVVEPHGNICYVVVTTPGTCTLNVYAENACSYTEPNNVFTITGTFYGVDEYEMLEADVYPNPTKDVIMIESEGIVKTTVLGLHGQIMRIDKFEGEDKVRIDVGDLPRGSYILLIETNSGRIFKNIVIDR